MNWRFDGHRLSGGRIDTTLKPEDGLDLERSVSERSGDSRGPRNLLRWVHDHVLLDGTVQVVMMTLLAIGVARLASFSSEREYGGAPLPGGPPRIVARMRSLDAVAYLRGQARLHQKQAIEGSSVAVMRQP